MSPLSHGPDYVPRPWMLFVDGENFAIRAQKYAEENGRVIPSTLLAYRPGVYFWPISIFGSPSAAGGFYLNLQAISRRSYYYTSAKGESDKLTNIRRELWELGFKPIVFKRPPDESRKAKGVDIALATDMLSNAHRNNFDVAILASNDGDFLPVVEEVQRLGKAVYLLGIGDKVSSDLVLASDSYRDFGAEVLAHCDRAQAAP